VAKAPASIRRVDEIARDPENARVHSPEQIEQIAASIRRFGFVGAIAVVEGVVYAGNGRHEAVEGIYGAGGRVWLAPGEERGGKELPAGTIPVIDVSGWTEEERRAFALADNRIAENASWNEDRLREQLDGLAAIDFDLDAAGFDMGAVTVILSAGNEANDPYAHWVGMPEFDQQDKRAFRSIPVHFASQEDVDKFADLIGQKITEQTRYLWFPETPIERYADKAYEHAPE
jgi:hypothetical protein